MRRCGRFLILLVLSLSLGLHWAALQTAAWTRMLVSYSRQASFQEAWQMTFDGQHPCRLCKFVQAGRAAEQEQQQQKGWLPMPKLDPVPPAPAAPVVTPPVAVAWSAGFAAPPAWSSRPEAPPLPPPREA